MAGKETDVFGFDELAKAFVRLEARYDSKSEALLMSMINQAKKRVVQKTPMGKEKKSGEKKVHLKKSWRVLRVKEFPNGPSKVARLQSSASHAHLYEYPHEVYTTKGNRKTGKVNRYNETARRAMGIKSHGKTQGHYVLRDTMREMETRFRKNAEKMLDAVTEELEV